MLTDTREPSGVLPPHMTGTLCNQSEPKRSTSAGILSRASPSDSHREPCCKDLAKTSTGRPAFWQVAAWSRGNLYTAVQAASSDTGPPAAGRSLPSLPGRWRHTAEGPPRGCGSSAACGGCCRWTAELLCPDALPEGQPGCSCPCQRSLPAARSRCGAAPGCCRQPSAQRCHRRWRLPTACCWQTRGFIELGRCCRHPSNSVHATPCWFKHTRLLFMTFLAYPGDCKDLRQALHMRPSCNPLVRRNGSMKTRCDPVSWCAALSGTAG